MSPLLSVLAASVTTFAATNLDDIFLLTVFFARRIPTRRIVAGQFLGFVSILVASCVMAWGIGLTIPLKWVRLLGILPLAIGAKELFRTHRSKPRNTAATDGSLSVFSIAAVTLANGADNIGVYVPFFLVSRPHLWLVLIVYGLSILVWCAVGKWFGSHTLVLRSLDRWGHWIVPSVLIGLGSYILFFMSP